MFGPKYLLRRCLDVLGSRISKKQPPFQVPILQLPCYFSGVYSSYSSLNIFVNLAELNSNFSHCKAFRKASEFGIWIWEVVRSYLLGRCNLANDKCVSGIFTWSNSVTSAWEQVVFLRNNMINTEQPEMEIHPKQLIAHVSKRLWSWDVITCLWNR